MSNKTAAPRFDEIMFIISSNRDNEAIVTTICHMLEEGRQNEVIALLRSALNFKYNDPSSLAPEVLEQYKGEIREEILTKLKELKAGDSRPQHLSTNISSVTGNYPRHAIKQLSEYPFQPMLFDQFEWTKLETTPPEFQVIYDEIWVFQADNSNLCFLCVNYNEKGEVLDTYYCQLDLEEAP